MIYSNINLDKEELDMSFGKMSAFVMGGNKGVMLPSNIHNNIKKGMNENITIGTTKSGRPRVNRGDDGNLYMILSTECDSRGHEIALSSLYADRIDVLAFAGLSQYNCCVLKVPKDLDIVIKAVMPEPEYYLIHEGKVYTGDINRIYELCNRFGVTIPIEPKENKPGIEDNGYKYNYWEPVTSIRQAKEFPNNEAGIIYALTGSSELAAYVGLEKLSDDGIHKYILEKIKVSSYDRFFKSGDIEYFENVIFTKYKDVVLNNEDIVDELIKIGYLNNVFNEVRKTSARGIFNIKSDRINKHKEIINEIFKKYPEKIKFMDEYLCRDIYQFLENPPLDIQENYVLNGGKNFSKAMDYINTIKEKPMKELGEIIKKNPYLIKQIKLNENELCKHLKEYPSSIRLIDNPTDMMYRAALSGDGLLLRIIDNPTDEMYRTALSENGLAIKYIPPEKQTPEFQMIAVKNQEYRTRVVERWGDYYKTKDKVGLDYIANPTDEVQSWIFDNHREILYDIITRIKNPNVELICNKLHEMQNDYEHFYEPEKAAKSIAAKLEKKGDEHISATLLKSGFIDKLTYSKGFSLETMEYLLSVRPLRTDQLEDVKENYRIEDMSNNMVKALYDENMLTSQEIINAGKMTEDIMADIFEKAIENNTNETSLMGEIIDSGLYYYDKFTSDFIAKIYIEGIDSHFKEYVNDYVIFQTIREHDKKSYEAVNIAMIKKNPYEIHNITHPNMLSDSFYDNVKEITQGKEMFVDILKLRKNQMPESFIKKMLEDTSHTPCFNFSASHRDTGKIYQSIAYVINKNGETVSHDDFAWRNRNHRFRETAATAEGTRYWTNQPIDSIAIQMTKENSSEPCVFKIKWMPENVTQEQKAKISEIESQLYEKYAAFSKNDTWSAKIKENEAHKKSRVTDINLHDYLKKTEKQTKPIVKAKTTEELINTAKQMKEKEESNNTEKAKRNQKDNNKNINGKWDGNPGE